MIGTRSAANEIQDEMSGRDLARSAQLVWTDAIGTLPFELDTDPAAVHLPSLQNADYSSYFTRDSYLPPLDSISNSFG